MSENNSLFHGKSSNINNNLEASFSKVK